MEGAKSGLLRESLACLDEALKLELEHRPALFTRGMVLVEMGKKVPGLRSLERALQTLEPALEEARYAEVAELCASLEVPDEQRPLLLRVQASALIKLQRPKEAAKLLSKILKGDRGDAAAWTLKGIAQGARGKWEDALDCYDKALELDMDDPLTWWADARALYLQGYREDALDCVRSLLRLEPEHAGGVWMRQELLTHAQAVSPWLDRENEEEEG